MIATLFTLKDSAGTPTPLGPWFAALGLDQGYQVVNQFLDRLFIAGGSLLDDTAFQRPEQIQGQTVLQRVLAEQNGLPTTFRAMKSLGHPT